MSNLLGYLKDIALVAGVVLYLACVALFYIGLLAIPAAVVYMLVTK